MLRRLLLMTLVILIAVVPSATNGWQRPNERTSDIQYTHQPPIGNAKPASKPWSAVIGKKVQVEGIAWGGEKSWGESVLIDGARAYVADAGFQEKGAHGRLVRVEGTLDAVRIKAAIYGAQGTGSDFTLYVIRQPVWQKIDQVEWPWLQERP
jgi:hypothetical protein